MISDEELMNKAMEAMNFSYSPYSRFKVGAALVTSDGCIYTGCNIENASFGATNCAERTAIFKAVSEGHNAFSKIAICSSSKKKTPPCGICLQVMSEFASDDLIIILQEEDNLYNYSLKDFLPVSFKL